MTYQISRNGNIIGTFNPSEMSSKVATGVVLPTDHYWIAGMPNWLLVSTNKDWMSPTPSNQSPPPPLPPLSPRSVMPTATPRQGKSYPSDMMVCTQCGCTATETHTKGSFFIEVILWIFLCIPGLIYSIWRLTTRGKICSSCKSDKLVSANSPIGQRMLST